MSECAGLAIQCFPVLTGWPTTSIESSYIFAMDANHCRWTSSKSYEETG